MAWRFERTLLCPARRLSTASRPRVSGGVARPRPFASARARPVSALEESSGGLREASRGRRCSEQAFFAQLRLAQKRPYKDPSSFDDDFFGIDDQYDYEGFEWYEDEEDLWTWSKYRDEEAPQIVERVYVERADDDDDPVLPYLFAGAAVVMAGGIAVGFVLGLLYASQRRRPVPATLYRVASKDVDAAGLADLAFAEVV